MNNKDNFYITTPIFYASGDLHLGHVYTATACDVLARWNRQLGKKVFFLTGSDEHGQKVSNKAKEIGIHPKVYTDSIVKKFQKTLKKMNISYDYFIRTTQEDHKKFIQKILQKAYDKGDIYKDIYKGLYCVDCEKYYKQEDLLEGDICPDHKKKVDTVEEENYFFRLSKYQDKLLDLYKENSEFLSPSSKSQETLNRVQDGLEDISISRSKEKLDWGIELPFDPTHVTYVWFDALFNYVSALDINEKNEFWPASVHVIGKDIMWFHKVYFPAFLMSVGLEIPKKVFAHGWWTVEGEKMGKSMGNVLDPLKITEKFGLDEFRYYMFAISSFGDDLDFSEQGFIDKINNDLNNDLGNLVSRVHAMTTRDCEQRGTGILGIVEGDLLEVDLKLLDSLSFFNEFDSFMQELDFHKALDLIFTKIREVNAYVNLVSPWKEEDSKRLSVILNILSSCCILFGQYLKSFIPEKSSRLLKQFNVSEEFSKQINFLPQGHELGEKDNLFQKFKVEKLKVEEEKVEEKEGFAVLNLKVGKILSIEQHPEAEKLYVEKIDLGDGDVRQIVSGLKDYYSLDEMAGRIVVVVANLKPAKLRGVKSEGMVLLAENDKGKLGFLESDAPIGTQLVCNSVVADNLDKIKVDKFFKYKLLSVGSHVEYESKKITAGDHQLQVEKNIKGQVR